MRIGLILTLVIFSLGSCTLTLPTYQSSFAHLPRVAAEEQRVLFQRICQGQTLEQEARALFSVHLTQGDREERFRYALALQRPKRMRIDVLPPALAKALGILLIEEERALFVDEQEEKVFQARSAKDLMARFFKVPLSAADLMDILLADPLCRAEANDFEVVEGEGVFWFLALGGRFQAAYQSDTLLPEQLQLFDAFSESLQLRVRYADFYKVEGSTFPRELLFEMPTENTQVKLRSRLWKRGVSGKQFQLRLPAYPRYEL